ncbi:methionyl-tRNA formyltransferase [Cerasicoccus frondis]|uniref:methionyl-tRNA formyltransferase n=1 Tax=Cerasicoccus frondis TaxID=490090 RepID=UPI002852B30B|nr:methionyl-tRNA formyltransferase [Cerasicoccus frondis]
MPNVVFFGSDPISIPLLNWLRETPPPGVKLVGVVSQPDRRKGRGKQLSPNDISAWALEHDIELLRPEKPGLELEDWLRERDIALALVMAYGHILKKSLLAVPPRGFVNFHASLLPAYRGASPIETAVANGETETGVSLMRIVPKMDAGAVCDVERVQVEPSDTGADMRGKLADACPALLERNLEALLTGEAAFAEQDPEAVTYCRKLEKADGALDFNAPAKALAARVNGLFPWPGCYFDHHGERIKVCGGYAESGHGSVGEILSASVDGLVIACGEGALRLQQLQRPGAKMLTAGDFLRGYPLESGTFLDSGELTKLVSKSPFPRKV